MKIKKIKSQGEFVYPATIAAAIKDANFIKNDDTPMTLGEINLYLNQKIDDNSDKDDALKTLLDITEDSSTYESTRLTTIESLISSLNDDIGDIGTLLDKLNGATV